MLWKLLAWAVSRPAVAEYLIRRAMRTPYFNLIGYMNRYWLFNGYSDGPNLCPKRFKRLPSVRIHHILREDVGAHLHDHPWNARTIILKGWYKETRLIADPSQWTKRMIRRDFLRTRGETARIDFGEFHEITEVSYGGVWTLFICWDYLGKWGFLVDGVKVPHDQYDESKRLPSA